MKFEETYLNDNILDALYDMRFEEMTPIQERCIPEILDGHDILGVAQTGTGKTAAYLLPILSMLDDGYADFPDGRSVDFPKDAINCIIMAPTRELAQQIDRAMQGFSYYLSNVGSVAVYGGNDGNRYFQELNALKTGADVIIATPGRFISHLTMDNVDMSRVSFFVLDEADRMLDMGFYDDILKIAKKLPPTCQTVMFSATMPEKIEQLAKTLLKNPTEVKIAVSKPAEKIQQSAYVCYEPQKLGIIESMFKQNDLKRVIIFAGKINKVKDVYRALLRLNINAGEMHSDLLQAERDEMMFRFKSGKIDVLVATDILSRGIDIDDIAMVINYDVPRDAEDYVHRIGRTARADRDGRAVTFVSPDDVRYFQQIERFLEREITKNPLPDGLGEGPEYKFAEPKRRKKWHGKHRGGKGKGRGRGSSKNRGGKSKGNGKNRE
ncbi:MAG: DEAD/DEAH box helicase [Prevotella sp.]|nr:DEAD/DEAH box helicase [Prevotella sp.]